MLKILRRLLETRFEPNMKKQAQNFREHGKKNRRLHIDIDIDRKGTRIGG